ncbi:MAG: hypothetical protein RL120_04795 [Gammaproteobacteria bacterium]
MRKPRKPLHALFVEDEVYNWTSNKTSVNGKLVFLGLLIVVMALLFGVLN